MSTYAHTARMRTVPAMYLEARAVIDPRLGRPALDGVDRRRSPASPAIGGLARAAMDGIIFQCERATGNRTGEPRRNAPDENS